MKVNNTIVISVGQAGNQIAASFWKAVCQEHGIDPLTGQVQSGQTPRGNWNSFFSQLGDRGSGSYVPRAVMCDLEPSVIEEVKNTSGSLFNPANLLSRTEGAGGNFAVGNLGEGRELLAEVMSRILGEIDKCDNVGGIIMLHSLGGGTGSGLGALIIQNIKEQRPEVPILSCAILPSPQVSSVVTEPYNTVFALNTLRRLADACLVDNEALFELAHRKWNIESPTVDDLNLLITEVLTGLTASMRFSGFLTVEISLRELLTNLVPQPSLHFLMCAFAPLTPPDRSKFEEMNIEDMIKGLFANDAVFAACAPMEGRFLSTAVLYRGIMDDKPQADASLAAVKETLPLTYWIPTAFKIGYVEQAGANHRKSMVMVANNTEISRVLDRICHNFDKLWQRKAFANWYLNEGMTEAQINEMRASVQELIQLYQVAEESGAKTIARDDVRQDSGYRGAAIQTPVAQDPAPTPTTPSTASSVSLRDLVDRRNR